MKEYTDEQYEAAGAALDEAMNRWLTDNGADYYEADSPDEYDAVVMPISTFLAIIHGSPKTKALPSVGCLRGRHENRF